MPRPPFTLPADYGRIKQVQSFDELVSTPFRNGVNALCWPRTLVGNFEEVVSQLGVSAGLGSLDEEQLNALTLSDAGRAAVKILLEDWQRLRDRGLSPSLDCIAGYPRETEPGPVPLDVYSWHADSATIEADTYLCSYTVAASEGLRHEEAQRCIDVPATRTQLLQAFGGADDAAFAEYLSENCYDLHYVARAGAQPFAFGLGNLWRIAVDFPGSPVPPCVHRAPETPPGSPPRLLLIS
jgi:hypothetical protein